MTEPELQAEWLYLYTERLGILCADAKPTPEQSAMAAQEANEAVMRLEEE